MSASDAQETAMIAVLAPAFRRILRAPPRPPFSATHRTVAATRTEASAPSVSGPINEPINEPIDEPPTGFLGWFDSSRELLTGLQVVELGALPEGAALPLS